MGRRPRNGGRTGDEAGILPEEPVDVREKVRDARRRDAEDAGWMSMVGGDPALFIKGSEQSPGFQPSPGAGRRVPPGCNEVRAAGGSSGA